MKIDDSQKKQIAVMCCLIAVFVAFGAYRLVGMRTHAGSPSEKPSQVVVKKQPAQTTAADRQVAAESPADDPVVAQKPRDPFEPQFVPQAQKSKPSSPSSRAPLPLVAQGSNLPFPLIPPLGTQPIRIEQSAEPEEDPTRELRLTGVIEGEINVAIIRGAGNKRYIVREGQSIDGKYTVVSISQAGVRLRYQGKGVVLKTGRSDAT